jgi:hypothetical protein
MPWKLCCSGFFWMWVMSPALQVTDCPKKKNNNNCRIWNGKSVTSWRFSVTAGYHGSVFIGSFLDDVISVEFTFLLKLPFVCVWKETSDWSKAVYFHSYSYSLFWQDLLDKVHQNFTWHSFLTLYLLILLSLLLLLKMQVLVDTCLGHSVCRVIVIFHKACFLKMCDTIGIAGSFKW